MLITEFSFKQDRYHPGEQQQKQKLSPLNPSRNKFELASVGFFVFDCDISIYILQGSQPTDCCKQTCLLFEEAVQFLVGPRGKKGNSLVELYWEARHFSYVDIIQTRWRYLQGRFRNAKLLPSILRTKYFKNSVIAPEQSSVGNYTRHPWQYLAGFSQAICSLGQWAF